MPDVLVQRYSAKMTSIPSSDAWMTSGQGHPRRWASLSVLIFGLTVVVLDTSVLNIALPTIQQDLQASQSELVWSVDSYLLSFAALLFAWGALGDRFGRKRIVMIGLVIFGIASAISAFAATPGVLITFRALMGIGGAAVLPTTLAIITVIFPPHERGKAIGVWAGAVGGAIALGPVLGGLLLQNPQWSNWLVGNDWGVVFFINVPIVIIGLIAVWRVVPESRNPNPRRLDVVGLLVSATGLVLLVYGIIHASETLNWLAPGVIIPIVAGLIIIGVFIWIEARSENASFDVSLFRHRGYFVTLLSLSLAFFALSGITFSLPFYLQILRGYDTLAAGLCFLPFAVGQLLAGPRSAKTVLRIGYKATISGGLVLVAGALMALMFLGIDWPLWAILIIFFVFGFGMGNVIAPSSTVMQNVLPLARAGAGSAVQNTVRQVFGALGVAIVGTVLATTYAHNVTTVLDREVPMLPEEAGAVAQESIVATVSVLNQAQQQGIPDSIIETARAGVFDAFLSASHVGFAISLGGVLVATAMILFGLPHIQPPRATALREPTHDATDELVAREERDYPREAAEEVER